MDRGDWWAIVHGIVKSHYEGLTLSLAFQNKQTIHTYT